jgi:hypothetical protein
VGASFHNANPPFSLFEILGYEILDFSDTPFYEANFILLVVEFVMK